MPTIHEHFVIRLTDETEAAEARTRARATFLALPGVRGWRTHTSTATDRSTLFMETFTFDDAAAAKAAGARFSEMPETRAFLALIDETIVGQHFADITED
ncbi:hypothetical protein [Jannaschia aquimarina]|uniref:ABM domain-containing protein n=1 Tax=Jannaschia aquimarina TaxID=935700 RepID=A0A0D1CPA9_9RHOB|nr:hypothetical protein [Jannaschia aquimarina]KIT16602.1 hypothetical protein jaqu_16460 [Jannaschia aquimarina]SNT44349.1 hypothetical protein SAMN05421775_1277 [Jannaschia aquimarina]